VTSIHKFRSPHLSFFLTPFLIFALILAHSITVKAAVNADMVYWVFDVGTADSQFGYWDGTNSSPVGGSFADSDFEGLACIGSDIYATSGLDGDSPSQLAHVAINISENTSSVTNVGTIETAGGLPFFEVASLGLRSSDNTLWAFAAEPGTNGAGTGIIKIDPVTGKAELKQASALDVAAVAWIGNTLWLAAGHDIYTWTEGGSISAAPAFTLPQIAEIEALDATSAGTLYVGGDDSPIMEVSTTGTVLNANVFIVRDAQGAQGDPESLTVCAVAPTALEPSAEPAARQHTIFLPFVVH
jgi:hypothetical protein